MRSFNEIKWKSFKDEYPKYGNRIFYYEKGMGVGYYANFQKIYPKWTHWMPLEFPEPPEEE